MDNKATLKDKTEQMSYDQVGADFFTEFWEESWTYIKTVVDVLSEPVIILDNTCTVLAANAAFYNLFQVELKDTEGKSMYELGNGQWDIPKLRKLMQDIIPKNTFFKGFAVEHAFPVIGQRTMILNGRHIHTKDKRKADLFPPIIMIAIEDVSEIMSIASQLAKYTSQLERTLNTRTQKLETKIAILEKKINVVKKAKK